MEEKKIDSSSIKLQNRSLVYRFIRDNQLVSKQDIVNGLRLSLPTVTQNLNYLAGQELIDTSGQIRKTGGRNATGYSILAKARYSIGVSLTGHHINVVSMDLTGEISIVLRQKITFDLDSDEYLKRVGQMVEEAAEKTGISKDRLLGVGIAVPGIISENGEEVISGFAFNFTGKKKEEIAKYIPYSSRLFHDSYTGGYAEKGAYPALKRAFYICLGTSVGGAIFNADGMDQGDMHKAGEIGHMIISPSSKRKCYCGNYGCFDTFCNSNVLDDYTDGNLEEFFRQRDAGNTAFIKAWDKYLDYLAIGIHNIRMLFDTKIVIGGYVGPYVADDFEKICRKVDKFHSFAFEDKAENYLIPCKSKIETIAEGAAKLFIDEFLDEVLMENDSSSE